MSKLAFSAAPVRHLGTSAYCTADPCRNELHTTRVVFGSQQRQAAPEALAGVPLPTRLAVPYRCCCAAVQLQGQPQWASPWGLGGFDVDGKSCRFCTSGAQVAVVFLAHMENLLFVGVSCGR